MCRPIGHIWCVPPSICMGDLWRSHTNLSVALSTCGLTKQSELHQEPSSFWLSPRLIFGSTGKDECHVVGAAEQKEWQTDTDTCMLIWLQSAFAVKRCWGYMMVYEGTEISVLVKSDSCRCRTLCGTSCMFVVHAHLTPPILRCKPQDRWNWSLIGQLHLQNIENRCPQRPLSARDALIATHPRCEFVTMTLRCFAHNATWTWESCDQQVVKGTRRWHDFLHGIPCLAFTCSRLRNSTDLNCRVKAGQVNNSPQSPLRQFRLHSFLPTQWWSLNKPANDSRSVSNNDYGIGIPHGLW